MHYGQLENSECTRNARGENKKTNSSPLEKKFLSSSVSRALRP